MTDDRERRLPRVKSADRQPEPSRGGATAQLTTAEAAVAALLAHGIDTVYALPGVHNDHLFDALFEAQDHIRTIHCRHEQGAAYLALGAALATGKPQTYAVVPGPGLLNSAAALLTSYGMNAPVLALIGQIPQSAIGRAYIWTLGTLLASGAGFALMLASIDAASPQAAAVVVYSLAWVAGFLAVIVPAGLGVREAVLMALLPASAGTIVAVSICHRLLTMAVEGAALFAARSRTP